MKTVILAGGMGTRISEETDVRPKPMVEIGGRPILWHLLKIYSSHGFNDFIVCLGYKGYIIKEFFINYFMHMSNITVDLRDGSVQVHDSQAEPWKVTLVDTGVHTQTGGRIKRVREYLGDQAFLLTYGDGLADVDLRELVAFHRAHGGLVTVTAVQPPGRFGALRLGGESRVESFMEKPPGDGAWINGGFFVVDPQAIDFIEGDYTYWEGEALSALAAQGHLHAFRHTGFWKAMDTLRDKRELETLWEQGRAPWKSW